MSTDVLCRKSKGYNCGRSHPTTVCGSHKPGGDVMMWTEHVEETETWETERERSVLEKKCTLAGRRETGEKGEKKENKSKKEQLLKMLSWKCFRWPLTSNKSSVFLNTEKSLLTSELIPATLTSKNNKAHKNIKVHPLQLSEKKNVFNFSDEKHLNWLNLL